MKREIKFRVWDIAKKQPMIYFGSDFWLDDDTDTISFPVANGTQILGDNNQDGNRFILMQFTSLHDKNKDEIYEGDIIEIKEVNEFGSMSVQNLAVAWCSHEGNWSLTKKPHDPNFEHFIMGSSVKLFKIIGNIYQNPELLDR